MAITIVVDAGHNGVTDPGAVYNGRRESDDNLRLALAVGNILAQSGYDVEYTRTGDIPQTVLQKAELANEADAQLFLSIHRNQGGYPGQYNGVQTLLYDLNGLKLSMAEAINQNLEGIGFRNISVDARPDLAVLRRTRMPALLVEVGFIDSEKDNALFDERLPEIAQAIADGVMDTLLQEQEAREEAVPAARTGPASGQPGAQPPQMPHISVPPAAPDGQTPGPQKPEPSPRPLYRVQVGAFYQLSHAVELEQELKRMGYNTWIVTV